jgi:predicted GNAT family acetyltransferase
MATGEQDHDMDVQDDRERHRFALEVEGHLAHLDYRQEADRLVLVHTEVPEALGGRGLGGTLVEAAVDAAAAQGLIVVAECSFAAQWLERHPDVAARAEVVLPAG